MRIKLKGGYQRKLILEAKENITWKELSKELKLNHAYLSNELSKEKRLLPEKVYKKLCELTKKNYDDYIKEKLKDNWGRSKGGLNSIQSPKIIVKEESKDLAELLGIILGDGNLWIKKGYYYLTIAGDKNKDKKYLLNHVNSLFKKLFDKELRVYEAKDNNGIYLTIGSKDIIHTLNFFGVPSGNKVNNNVKIPEWIFKNNEYLAACIRGLMDTDGCVCPITGRNYSYLWFSSKTENLRLSFDRAMKQLGIKTSKWNIRKNRTPEVFIAGKDEIRKYMQMISFKNEKHLGKLKALVV